MTSDKAEKATEKLKNLHEQLWNDINFMNLQASVYYNKSHEDGPTLKRGEKVYLLCRNIKTKQPSQKLNHQKIRPFTIEKQTGPVNYQLRLPESMKHLHPVFHISLLEPAPQNAQITENVKIEEDDEYEVEKILKHKRINGRPFYLVKWKGYGTSENTWEPIANLKGCHQAMQDYQQTSQGHSRRKENPTSGSD